MKTTFCKRSLLRALTWNALTAAALCFPTVSSAQSDVTQPGDPIEFVNGVNDGDAYVGPPPVAEGVEHAIDNVGQQFLGIPAGPPQILSQPASRAGLEGTTVTFTVVADGARPLAYERYFEGVNPIAGATNATLVLSNVQLAATGDYRVVVTNALGSATSSNAHLELGKAAPSQFCADFDSGLPSGMTVFGTNASVDGGYLKLTRATSRQFGVAYTNDFCGGRVTAFRATFNALLFGGSSWPADGFSFNLVPGAELSPSPGYSHYEEGLNSGLAMTTTGSTTSASEPSHNSSPGGGNK